MPRSLSQRLNIIKGQINGIDRLIQEEADCHQIVEQLLAIQSALRKVTELYLSKNLRACLRQPRLKKKDELDFLLREILKK